MTLHLTILSLTIFGASAKEDTLDSRLQQLEQELESTEDENSHAMIRMPDTANYRMPMIQPSHPGLTLTQGEVDSAAQRSREYSLSFRNDPAGISEKERQALHTYVCHIINTGAHEVFLSSQTQLTLRIGKDGTIRSARLKSSQSRKERGAAQEKIMSRKVEPFPSEIAGQEIEITLNGEYVSFRVPPLHVEVAIRKTQ